jgi:large subunit ribosomal protein L21
MLAVIKTGGKQYIVKAGDKIKVELLDGDPGTEVSFSDVLLLGDDNQLKIGTPVVKDAKVKGKILGHGKGKKLIIFKYKPKKRYKRKIGHRQQFTDVEIISVSQ